MGHMHNTSRMKRTAAVAALAASAALASCGGGDSSSSSSSSSSGGGTVTTPGEPTITGTTEGNGLITIAFTAPSDNGGAAITSYEGTCTGGGASFTGTATSSPVNVSGLTNGTVYSCSVTATNSAGAGGASATADATPAVSTVATLPLEFNQFGNNVSVLFNQAAGTVTLEALGRPDHSSPYWDEDGDSGLYVEAGPETTVSRMSPGRIDEYTDMYFLTVDVDPQLATTSTATSLGAIGLAITGSPIFNAQEGPNISLNSGVMSGFDDYGAHTGPQVYHYHLEPTPISNDDDTLFAILADGFFLYGRRCASTTNVPTDLDASGGHVSPTQYNAEAHYHYHIIDELYLTVNDKDTYLLFDGNYQGTPATITN